MHIPTISDLNVSRQQVRCGDDVVEYKVVDGILTVYRDGQKAQMKVAIGDLIFVSAREKILQLTKVLTPTRKIDFLPWLFGFRQNERYYSRETYEQALQEKRREHDIIKEVVFTCSGPGFELATYCDPQTGSRKWLAAYVDCNAKIDKKFILEALWNCDGMSIPYPRSFVKGVLAEKFDLDDDDLTDIDLMDQAYHLCRWK